MSPCFVTLLVCTRNGARTIESCLQHCLAEIHRPGAPNAELVVVDNGSTDGTLALVEAVAQEARGSIRLLHAAVPGKNHAFETGVRAAAADIVAIIDDDNYIDAGYLDHVMDFFRDYPGAAAVGSANRLHESVAAPEWFDWAKDQFACTRPVIGGDVMRDERGREVGDLGFIAGAGMAFRKGPLLQALDAGYRFFSNTDRQAGISGEDIELCFLLRSMGHRLGYDPRMTLSHDVAEARLTPAAFWKLCESIGAGSLAIDPFIFTPPRHTGPLPLTWRWPWQLLAKVKRWAKACLHAGQPDAAREERRFRRRREHHQGWGAVRFLLRHRALYTDHVHRIASGSWTRLRLR